MTRPHARAGQPYDYPIDFAGDEPEDVETVDQFASDVMAVTTAAILVPLVLFVIVSIAMFIGYWSAT